MDDLSKPDMSNGSGLGPEEPRRPPRRADLKLDLDLNPESSVPGAGRSSKWARYITPTPYNTPTTPGRN